MTYSVGGTTIIYANGTIDWSHITANVYYGTANTRQVANNTAGVATRYGYKIEEANTTSVRLVCTTFNCACVCECIGTCFLEDAIVTMADGSTKRISDVKVGEYVLGAFGEMNKVIALDRTILGPRKMININGEHLTSWEHPHVGFDRQFYVPNKEAILKEWGLKYPLVNAEGELVWKTNIGLESHRLRNMAIGDILQTINGARKIDTLETLDMPSDTPLFNLVVDGSHTFIVDNYAVTGWPKEDDFDYDNWKIRNLTKLEDYPE